MSDVMWVGLAAILMLLMGTLSGPFKMVTKLAVRSGIGALLILLFNYIGGFISLSLSFNLATVLIAGFLGIPGVVLLTYMRYIAP